MQNYKNQIESALSHIKPDMFVPQQGNMGGAKDKWVETLGRDLAQIFNETNWFSAQWKGNNQLEISKQGKWPGSDQWHSTITMEPNAEEQYMGLKVKFFTNGAPRQSTGTGTEEAKFFINWSNPNIQPFVSCMEKKLVKEAGQMKKQ